jgi:hypothetical protein
LNAVYDLYLTGNSYAVAIRNERYEIDELHLMDARQSSPCVVRNRDDRDAEIFYRLSGNRAAVGSPANPRSKQRRSPSAAA